MVQRRLGRAHDRRQKPIVYPTSQVGRAIAFRGLSCGPHGLREYLEGKAPRLEDTLRRIIRVELKPSAA